MGAIVDDTKGKRDPPELLVFSGSDWFTTIGR